VNGLQLKLKRIEAGVRQYRLAAALDIPPATLSYYENEHRPIPPGMQERILAAIDELGHSGERSDAHKGRPPTVILGGSRHRRPARPQRSGVQAKG